jgi:hypothetical protein
MVPPTWAISWILCHTNCGRSVVVASCSRRREQRRSRGQTCHCTHIRTSSGPATTHVPDLCGLAQLTVCLSTAFLSRCLAPIHRLGVAGRSTGQFAEICRGSSTLVLDTRPIKSHYWSIHVFFSYSFFFALVACTIFDISCTHACIIVTSWISLSSE